MSEKIEQKEAQKIAELLKSASDRGEEAEKATRGKGRFIKTEEGINGELRQAREFAERAIALINRCVPGAVAFVPAEQRGKVE